MGKALVVTGGSRGIGRSVCLIAARRGYSVCINYAKNQAAALQVKDQIEKSGGTAIAVQADISNNDDVVRLFKEADKLGPLSGLVNNAGILPKPGLIEDITPEKMQLMFSVNVFGSFYCAREAVMRMSTKHGGAGGAIVNLSSAGAKRGGAGRTLDYAAAKGAIDVFTLGLARELAEVGVRVNAARPGPTATELTLTYEPHHLAKMTKQVPLQRAGKPEEIAYAILWLLSDEASFVTGATLNVTGGLV
jgi:NAD(P)-dependent dehydrogenase (short-subunit alcohol dehydrogenase family)